MRAAMGSFKAWTVVSSSSSCSCSTSRRTQVVMVLAIACYVFGLATSPLLPVFLECAQPLLNFRSEESLMVTETTTLHGRSVQTVLANWNSSDLVRFEMQCGEPLSPQAAWTTLLDRLFDGVSPFEGFPPEHVKPLVRKSRIKSWASHGAVFDELMREVKPSVVVEVGSFLGASAIYMANLSRDLQLNTVFFCVDDYRGWPGFWDKFKDIEIVNGNVMLLYQFLQNVAFMNFTESILPLPFSTSSMLRKLCEWGVYADLIKVNAGHDFYSAWSDINTGLAILRPGGVFFGHDYFSEIDNKGVRRAVDLFAKVKGFTVERNGRHWILRSN